VSGHFSRPSWLLRFSYWIFPPVPGFPTPGARHRTTFGYIIALPATQGPAAEVPAGSRPPVVDSTTPLPDPAVVWRLLMQVPAGSIGKEKTVRFPKTAFAEVLQLVGFALPYKNNGEPAAAFPAAAAGAGCRGRVEGFHRASPAAV
jgi:hypothetical protein